MQELKLIENELVSVYKTSTGEKVVYGTELHAVLEVGRDYSTWVKGRLIECDAIEKEDFDSFPLNGGKPTGGRPKQEYIIKLDTAKEMAMLERNEKGKQVRRYFIAIERKFKERKNANRPACIEDVLIQSLQEMKDIRAKVDKQSIEMKAVKDAMTAPAAEEKFSEWVSKTIGNIAGSPEYADNPFRYQTAWGESYKRLQDKASCRLDVLLKNAKKRAEENGASKSKVKTISKLSVIEADKRLKALYIGVLQEMSVAYCVEVV